MHRLIVGIILFAALMLAPANAGQMSLLGAGSVSGATYQGPIDAVSGATSCWSLRACTNTYAAATGNVADLVATTGGAAVCTLKAATDGTADLVGTYCAGTTVPLACAAASGGSCRVSKLYDQVGTAHLVQATNGSRPPIAFGCTGGRPCLRCVLASGHLLQVTMGASSNQPNTFSVVSHRQANTTTTGYIAGTIGTNSYFGYSNAADTIAGNAGTNQTTTASDAAFHSVALVFNGASGDMNVDGTPNTKNMGAQAIGTGMGLCAVPGQGFGTGEITEFLIYNNKAFSGAESSTMYNNQRTYWGY